MFYLVPSYLLSSIFLPSISFFLVSVLELQFLNESPFFSVFTNTEAPVCNHPLHLDNSHSSFQPQFRNQVFLDSSLFIIVLKYGYGILYLALNKLQHVPALMLTSTALLCTHLLAFVRTSHQAVEKLSRLCLCSMLYSCHSHGTKFSATQNRHPVEMDS